jgi:hypothetical protein
MVSVHPSKTGSMLTYAMIIFFHTLFYSIFITHSTTLYYIVLATDNIVQQTINK